MVLGKEVAIFNWEWGRHSAPRDGQKMPCMCQHVVGYSDQNGIFSLVFLTKERSVCAYLALVYGDHWGKLSKYDSQICCRIIICAVHGFEYIRMFDL